MLRYNNTELTLTDTDVVVSDSILIGNDARISDVDVDNTLRVSGVTNTSSGYLQFGDADSKALGRTGTGDLTWNGNTILTSIGGNDITLYNGTADSPGLVLNAHGYNTWTNDNWNGVWRVYRGAGITPLSIEDGDVLKTMGYKVWHQGNDGSGSGLDADLLGGVASTDYMKKATDNMITRNILFNNGTTDSNGFTFISNTGATPSQDINVDIFSGELRFYRSSGLQTFNIGADNNLYADNGTNGRGRVLTTTTPLGYSTSSCGVGGTAAQGSFKTDTLTLNKLTGLITTANSALAAGASNVFTLNNNLIGANDGFYITPYYGNIDPFNYKIEVISTFQGGARIKITNISIATLSDIVHFKFQVLKGVIS